MENVSSQVLASSRQQMQHSLVAQPRALPAQRLPGELAVLVDLGKIDPQAAFLAHRALLQHPGGRVDALLDRLDALHLLRRQQLGVSTWPD